MHMPGMKLTNTLAEVYVGPSVNDYAFLNVLLSEVACRGFSMREIYADHIDGYKPGNIRNSLILHEAKRACAGIEYMEIVCAPVWMRDPMQLCDLEIPSLCSKLD